MPRVKPDAPRYVKFSLSLREDLYAQVEQVMEANKIDRSSAIAMMLSRVNIKDLLPPGYTPPPAPTKDEPPSDIR